jgi:hypothetical protein
MFLVYKPSSPERGEPEEWHFDPDRFPGMDAEAIERETGYTWLEFLMNVQKGSTLCYRALLWSFRRRQHRGLQMKDVRFDRGEVDLEYDKEELEQRLADLIDAPVPTRNDLALQHAMGITMLRKAVSEARPGPGKAIESGNGTSTSSISSPSVSESVTSET